MLKLHLDKENLGKKEVSIDLPTRFDDEQIPNTFIVKIIRSNAVGKNALACDEMIFN